MIDTATLSMFIHAVRTMVGTPENFPHVAFIGDDAQLLPVGFGQPILDFERSGIVPVYRLQQIHRHAHKSTLLTAVNALREREIVTQMDETFNIIGVTEKTLKPILLGWADAHPGDTNAIIVPTNELLNQITPFLREHLNPVSVNPPIMVGPFEFKFRVGDKVMQIKNNSFIDVYNGTCGRIVKYTQRKKMFIKANGKSEAIPQISLYVQFNDRSNETFYEMDEAREQLILAYAFTTHKAQGSEYDHTLILMNKPIPGFINRNLIYTGASRGKRSVTIALSSMNIRKGWQDLPAERRTNLVAMIHDKVEFEEESTPNSESSVAV
jgi:exodeoxyribonuclease V alpha subunit